MDLLLLQPTHAKGYRNQKLPVSPPTINKSQPASSASVQEAPHAAQASAGASGSLPGTQLGSSHEVPWSTLGLHRTSPPQNITTTTTLVSNIPHIYISTYYQHVGQMDMILAPDRRTFS